MESIAVLLGLATVWGHLTVVDAALALQYAYRFGLLVSLQVYHIAVRGRKISSFQHRNNKGKSQVVH